MSQEEIETILMRQLAGYLAMPVFLVDPGGKLLFYNEPAEAILGQRFEETGAMAPEMWGSVFTPTDAEGAPIAPEDLPLTRALTHCESGHLRFWIVGLDHTRREIEVTAFPLVGQGDRMLGAVAMFWEVDA
jgi:PAS domain-containing protein